MTIDEIQQFCDEFTAERVALEPERLAKIQELSYQMLSIVVWANIVIEENGFSSSYHDPFYQLAVALDELRNDQRSLVSK